MSVSGMGQAPEGKRMLGKVDYPKEFAARKRIGA
jgi:hypothetical protein